MKKNERGFSVIAVLVVVSITGLIGVVGWKVYDNKNREQYKDINKTESQATPKKEGSIEDETINWKVVKNTEFGFSYKYPNDNGWSDNLIKAEDQLYEHGERVNGAGVNYDLCGRNCGLVFAFSIYAKGKPADPGVSWGEKQMAGNTYYKLAGKGSVNKNGVTGTRWEYSPGDNNSAKIIYYYFIKGDLVYAFSINSNGAITDKIDLSERGEKIMQTFQFTN